MSKKKDLLTDITEKFNEAVEEMASEMTFQIEHAYEETIDEFYEDYDPVSYDRTYSTYLASTGYDNATTPLMHVGDAYFAGIGVNGSNIPGQPYEMPKHWVFDRTFYKGIHGINRNDVFKMNKDRTRDNRITIKNVPTNMKPAPKSVMKKKFKELTKKKNMDKIFDEIVNKHLKFD